MNSGPFIDSGFATPQYGFGFPTMMPPMVPQTEVYYQAKPPVPAPAPMEDPATINRGPPPTSKTDRLLWVGLIIAQFLTFCSYVVVTAGAALLQAKANTLTLFDGLTGTALSNMQAAYDDVFQSTNYIIPYKSDPKYQFQYEWWIIELEFFIFALTAFLTLKPSYIPRLKPVALTFLASALVLVMDNVNALFFLLRNDTAKAVFDEYRIATAQAGLMMVGCSNALTIWFMGAYQHTPPVYGSY